MDEPLRLLAFSHSAHLGGSEQLLLQLVRELIRDHGVASTVVVPADGPLVSRLQSAGAAVWIWSGEWWCRSKPATAEEVRGALSAGAASVLHNLEVVRSLDPHVLLSITTVVPWGGLAAALVGKPHVWYVTDFGGVSDYAPQYFLPFEEIRRALEEGADRLVVVSDAVRRRLFSSARDPIPVVQPHLEPPTASPIPDPVGEHSDAGRVRIAVFGNLRPSKGQWDAVSAVAELSRRGCEVELLLVGHPTTNEASISQHATRLGVADRVRVVGFVPDQAPWLATADIVLVASFEETFSLVCLEALLRGKPLVATRVGGIVEFVHDRVNGLTVPPGDTQAIASALELLIRDPGLARTLAEEGRRLAARKFTAERFSGRMRAILEDVVAEGRRCALPAALLAPVEALAAQHQIDIGLRTVGPEVEDLRGRLDRALAEGERTARALEHLTGELDAQRQARRDLETELQRLQASLRQVSDTRAWRLVHAYWRAVERLRRRG